MQTMLTTREATEALAVSRATLYRLAKLGKITPRRYDNGQVRWPSEQVDAVKAERPPVPTT